MNTNKFVKGIADTVDEGLFKPAMKDSFGIRGTVKSLNGPPRSLNGTFGTL
jgi:hypothetical protein